MIRTHGEGKVYHGEDAARTAGDLWRDGDLFVVKTTGAAYARTGGAWVQISTGTGTADHNSLSNFDGGTTGEYYHLTAAQHTDLTDGGDTTLHVHDAYIANSLLTARGDIITRGDIIPERLALTVPSAPTINFLGVINGELQPTWKSASSNPGGAAAILATDASGGLALSGDLLYVDAANNQVGINCTPTAMLDINAGGVTSLKMRVNNTISSFSHFAGDGTTFKGNLTYYDTPNKWRITSAGNLHLTSNSSDSGGIWLTTSNQVGVNKTDPSYTVDAAGDGRFSAGLVVNESGGGAATDDFRVESAGETNMLWLDASADLLYLGGSTNGVQIARGGNLTLLGTAKYTRHVQIPAVSNGTVANQPAQTDFFTVGGLQFSAALAKYAFCQWELPDDWDGTDIYFEVDWFPDSGAMSGADAIRWTVEYRAIAEGELVNQGTSVTLDNGAGGDTGDHARYKTVHSRMTLAYNNANQPLTAQDHIFFKVSRDVGVSGDFGGTVTVPAFEIIYTSTGFPTN